MTFHPLELELGTFSAVVMLCLYGQAMISLVALISWLLS